MGAYILAIHNLKYETDTLIYTMPIHCIQGYRHLLVYLIEVHSYISSLRQVPHHNAICTNSHLLVASHSTYHGPLLSQKLPNNTIAIS